MARLGELDLPDRLAAYMPVWASQAAFGVFCAGLAAAARAVVDFVSVGAGPYSLIYPAILLSTLFGRWPSGLITLVLSFLGAWYFILPAQYSFTFLDSADIPRSIVNAFSAAFIVVLAEIFRRAVRQAVDERNAKLEESELFLREFDHRMKNNFMMVSSLLNMQKRRATEPATQDALEAAALRVHGFASAHNQLYRKTGDVSRVEMKDYLEGLTHTLSEALLLRGDVTLRCRADHALMLRDRAVSIGLIVNELVTNAIKHAFVGRDSGVIEIDFTATPERCVLTVADNGGGIREAPDDGGGLGGSLIEAFAVQADAVLTRESTPKGTRARLEIAD